MCMGFFYYARAFPRNGSYAIGFGGSCIATGLNINFQPTSIIRERTVKALVRLRSSIHKEMCSSIHQ